MSDRHAPLAAEHWAEDWAEHWGGTDLTPISNRENAVWRMRLPGGQQAALRLHRPGYQTADAIRSELWFCDALAARGLPVPGCLPTLAGQSLVETGQGGYASAVTWLPGQPLGAASVSLAAPVPLQIARHHAIGRLLAQVHSATETLILPPDFTRPSWGLDGLLGDTPFWGRFWQHPALTKAEAGQMLTLRNQLRSALTPYTTATRQIPVHADVLRENVLVEGNNLALIDFDDSGFGYPLFDLGTVMSQNLYEPARAEIRQALMDGYRELRPVDGHAVDLFTLARCLASVGWTMGRLAPDNPIMRSHITRALQCAEMVLK
jgi:Ser/Thr protein kinase RdoA (MazF antagonist)